MSPIKIRGMMIEIRGSGNGGQKASENRRRFHQ